VNLELKGRDVDANVTLTKIVRYFPPAIHVQFDLVAVG
jgi:hypothetical protein